MREVSAEPSRRKQFLIGFSGVLAVAGVIAVSWRLAFFEGFIGELFSMIVGVFSTPVMLEASLIILGLIVVIAINTVRLRREGDEFVYLEEVSQPEGVSLPESARKVIYREAPEAPVEIGTLSLAEGAFELGDYPETWAHLQSLSEEEYASESVLALRLRLAVATGKRDSASGVVEQLKKLNSEHPALKEWERDE